MDEKNTLDPAQIESLNKSLEALKASKAAFENRSKAPPSTAGKAAADFLSALAVLSLIGFGVDYFINTSPWGLLIGVLAGTGVGAKLMMNTMTRND